MLALNSFVLCQPLHTKRKTYYESRSPLFNTSSRRFRLGLFRRRNSLKLISTDSLAWSKVELPSPGSTDQPIQTTSNTSTSNNEKSEMVPLQDPRHYQQQQHQLPLEKNLQNKQQPKKFVDDDSFVGTTRSNNGDESFHRHRRFFFMFVLGSCCCGIGWILMNHFNHHQQDNHNSKGNHDTVFTFGTSTNPEQKGDDDYMVEGPILPNNEAVEPGKLIPLRRRVPFSTSDPVHDLHLYDYHR